MGFTTLDYLIVALYLLGIGVFGILSGGKQRTTRDYFLGSKEIPWWAVCFAIVATETSTLTFISIPGLAYLTNLNFLQVTFGYLIGRILVSVIFLPSYIRGDLSTAYALMTSRFGAKTRNIASITFMFTRLIADGVRLFATAIPLAILLRGWQSFTAVSNEQIYVISIVVMATITIMYTFIGGVRAVVWTDVVQMFIYLLGAIAAGIVILASIPGGVSGVLSSVLLREKLSIFYMGFDKAFADFFKNPYTLAGGLIGGAFLSMASHGIDQLIVQRLLTVKTLKDSQRALIGSGVIVIMQFFLFLMMGLLLYSYYQGASLADLKLMKADEIFPKFIIERMPTGLSGLIIAGLLAAAMSTLSGSVNSLASATMNDIYKPYFGEDADDRKDVMLARLFTFMWAILLIGMAIFFIYSESRALVETALGVASFTYGGMLGLFLLGVLVRKARQVHAIIGFVAGVLTMIVVVRSGIVAWTWYTVIGSGTTVLIGALASMVMQKGKDS